MSAKPVGLGTWFRQHTQTGAVEKAEGSKLMTIWSLRCAWVVITRLTKARI